MLENLGSFVRPGHIREFAAFLAAGATQVEDVRPSPVPRRVTGDHYCIPVDPNP